MATFTGGGIELFRLVLIQQAEANLKPGDITP